MAAGIAANEIPALHKGVPGAASLQLASPAHPVDGGLARAVEEDTPLPVLAGPDAPATADRAPEVIDGPMEDVLYGGGPTAVAPKLIAQALRLFGHKLDLTRDLALGDRVRLVVDGAPAPVLDYAELDGAHGAVRLYRVAATGEEADAFADERGEPLRRQLLRTPLVHSRLTSGFGLRLHPLLGYTRMHKGVDFGAPVGTPVLAAGDGWVESARWAGGYGRLVRLRHMEGFETAYAHLSAWATGLNPGVQVRQGQVIGWTGQSGLATGPHLHFEVILKGQAIDPATAAPSAPPVSSTQRLAFEMRRREIEALLAAAPRPLRANGPGGG